MKGLELPEELQQKCLILRLFPGHVVVLQVESHQELAGLALVVHAVVLIEVHPLLFPDWPVK